MKRFYLLFGEGSRVNQVLCAVLINLPVFAYGAGVGWMSPMLLLLQSENGPRSVPLTDTEVSWMSAVAYLTCVPADFLMAYVSDRFGRRNALLVMSTLALSCWVLKLSSTEVWAFVLARALFGVTMAGSYVTCPLYTKEISEDSIRGLLGSLVILSHTLGNLFMYVMGDLLSYRAVLWLGFSLPAVHLALFFMLPESPSYLIKKGRHEEAIGVMAWLRCRSEDDNAVKKEIELLTQQQQKDTESSKFALKAILKDPQLRRAFRIALVVVLAREVCGAIPVLNFAGEIFTLASEGSTLMLSPNQQAMMLGAVQVMGSLLASSVVEKAGRKPLLFLSALLSGVSMTTLASWFLVRQMGISPPAWIPMAALCLCIFCDAAGLLPISVVLVGEIFSCKYSGTVFGCTMALASLADFLQLLFFKPLANAVGLYVAFYFFGGVCLIAALYIILVIPETRMKGIEEIYDRLKTKKERQMESKTLEAMNIQTTWVATVGPGEDEKKPDS